MLYSLNIIIVWLQEKMTELQNTLNCKIGDMVSSSASHRVIARRLFLYDFPTVFSSDQERGFNIMNAVCDHFKLPFSSLKVVGSAQTGYSYIKGRDFIQGDSDLDLAIINSDLFQYYSEEIYWLTDRYSDLTRFQRRNDVSSVQSFRNYLSEGQFRPDMMPNGKLKTDWFSFFNKLSNNHTEVFKNINAGIYLSEGFFVMKNSSIISEYKKAPK